MSDELIAGIRARASNADTIHDMAEGWTPEPRINPLATEEQLDAAEKRLGAKLPPLLRRIYAEIGNGGFGPGYGLYGCESLRDDLDDEEVAWRRGMVPFLTWGCGIVSCVDLRDPAYPVYVFDPEEHCLDMDYTMSKSDDGVIAVQLEPRKPAPEAVPVEAKFSPQKPSIEALFRDWAAGVNLWQEMSGDRAD